MRWIDGRFGGRGLIGGALVVAGLATAGCSDDEIVDRVAALTQAAEAARELPLLRAVPVDAISSAEFARLREADAAGIAPADLAALTDSYGRLGFFGPDVDLREAVVRSDDLVAAYYDPDSERITLIGAPRDETIVHEIVHALQDQHFDLVRYLDEVDTSDEELARRGATEGDAELAETRFYFQAHYDADLDLADWAHGFGALADQTAAMIDDAHKRGVPLFFVADMTFPYTHGLAFCIENLTGASPDSPKASRPAPYAWSREDELFGARAPDGTERVLTFGATGSTPVGLAAVPAALSGALEAVDTDVLGRWYTRLLLLPVDGAPGVGDTGELAARWAGDRALFVRATASDDAGVVWTSAWDDAAAATRVESALAELYGLERAADEPRSGTAADGEPVWLERSDALLVVAKNVDPTVAPELAVAALAPPSPKSAPGPSALARQAAAIRARLRPFAPR